MIENSKVEVEDKSKWMGSEYHIPVLFYETIELLLTDLNGAYVDCTLGGGGHSQGILNILGNDGKLLSLDQDQAAIDFAKNRIGSDSRWMITKENFENLDVAIYLNGLDQVDGILMDIGVSSNQLDDPERGFSFRNEAKLDMRMNKDNPFSAYNVVNEYTEDKLAYIIKEYGEERQARRIAGAIARKREEKPIETTLELAELIKEIVPYYRNKNKAKGKAKHPATKTFQAIRIEVNRELEVLTVAIDKALKVLKPGGRLAIITFHSLEDRIVKNKFKELATGCICPKELPICMCNNKPKVKILTRKPVTPSDEELAENIRARSSKLRVFEKLAVEE